MNRHLTLRALPALAFALVLSACGDTVEPPTDALAGLDEIGIYTAMVERVTAFNHTAEANANLRLALGHAIPPTAPIDSELFGHVLAYDADTEEWQAEPAPELPPDVLRITWHEIAGEFVAMPVSVRGHIDLTRRDDPLWNRLDVQAVRSDGNARILADYTARFGTSTGDTGEVRYFQAVGLVSDGSRQVEFLTVREATDESATGATRAGYALELSDQGFYYTVSIAEDRAEAGAPREVNIDAAATVENVTTRLLLALEDPLDGPLVGSGTVQLGGQQIALVDVAGSQITFRRTDGTDFRSVEQQRLLDLFAILFIPVQVVEPYFS